MSNNIFSIYYNEINKYNQISPEEEKELADRASSGDIEARNLLVTSHLKLVLLLVPHYQGCGVGTEDLIQEGNIGLIRAAEKFDPSKGNSFTTYAIWWIKQALNRAVAEQGRLIRVPVHIVEKMNKQRAARRKLVVLLEREPTDEELAEELKITVEEVEKISEIILDATSLDIIISNDESDTSLGDLIEDPNSIDPVEKCQYQDFKEIISKVLNTLTKKESEILLKHFGFQSDEPKSIEKISEELNLSGERVRQLEVKALRKLRSPQRANYIKKYCGII